MSEHVLSIPVQLPQYSPITAAAERPLHTPVVGWVSPLPAWVHGNEEILGPVESVGWGDLKKDPPEVVHVGADGLSKLSWLRRAAPQARIVLDLSGASTTYLGRRGAAQAAFADLILAGTLFDLRELRRRYPRLAQRTALFRQPFDLSEWGPGADLFAEAGRGLRRFRKLHRLVSPTVLYAGPFTPEGGLDLAIAAIHIARQSLPEARLAAIPIGTVSQRYLDRCERAALSLGHHGVFQWQTPAADELPAWFAVADVVCLPCRDAVPPSPVWLAGAAAKPVVVGDAPQLLEHVVDDCTGYLVPTGNVPTLAAALVALLGDGSEATRLGAAGRQKVEQERSPETAARELREFWTTTATRHSSLPPSTTARTWPALTETKAGH